MKYVLDSNVALKWVLPETDDAKAIGIRDGFKQGIRELLAPDVFPIDRLTRVLQPTFPFITSLASLP